MTLEEAQRIADIVATADGGCSSCVASLVELLNAAHPAIEWSYWNERITVRRNAAPRPPTIWRNADGSWSKLRPDGSEARHESPEEALWDRCGDCGQTRESSGPCICDTPPELR